MLWGLALSGILLANGLVSPSPVRQGSTLAAALLQGGPTADLGADEEGGLLSDDDDDVYQEDVAVRSNARYGRWETSLSYGNVLTLCLSGCLSLSLSAFLLSSPFPRRRSDHIGIDDGGLRAGSSRTVQPAPSRSI